MMLVIAEKPSVAQSIAAALGVKNRRDGYIEGNNYLVSWCFGHLAGLADAGAYNTDFAKWRLEHLPIIPEKYIYSISKGKEKQFKVNDKAYDKLGFSIHDYFFAKTLDQVRPGGVVAFVTSRYTMDKQSPEVRKYIAERAELLGAIRLPNTAFKANAGTEVVSDIIFLLQGVAGSSSLSTPGNIPVYSTYLGSHQL